MTNTAQQMVVMGKISGIYGVRGWLKVFSHTDPRENILSYSPWYLKDAEQWRPVDVIEGRRQGKNVLAHLKGYDDRDAAAALIETEIAINRDQLPQLPEGEYYWSDLLGMQVETVDGIELGCIDKLMQTGANDVIVVAGERQRLIPYIKNDVVVNVDLQARRMQVNWDPEF